MQYPEPDIDIDQTASPAAPQQEQSTKNSAESFLNKLNGRLRIRHKIGWGYALAIGVAVLGTMAGQFIGENVYEKQARLGHDRAAQEEYLLNQLKISLLEVRSHQQHLIPLLGNPQAWKRERTLYVESLAQLQSRLSELKDNAENHFHNLEADTKDLEVFVQNSEVVVSAYTQTLEATLQKIDTDRLPPKAVPAAQASLLQFAKSEVALNFDRISDHLSELIATAHREEQEASGEVEKAEELRTLITNVSLLLASALAALLSLYTSKAIAVPLEATTKVAKLVTETANFNLQAPVTTIDEIGQLTASVNQLIQRAATYTEELKQAQSARDRFFNLSLELLCIADFDGYFQQLNPAWSTTLGWTAAELQAKPFLEFVHPDDLAATIAEASKLHTGGETISFENRYLCGDGSYKWLAWAAVGVLEEGVIYAVARDITERKQMEAAVQQAKETLEIRVHERTAQLNHVVEQLESEIEGRQQAQEALDKEREFLNALLDNLTDGIVACDANGILTLFNRATREFHGVEDRWLPPEEWATYYNLYQPDGKTPLQQEEVPLFRALQGETIRNTEIVIAPKGGKSRIILANGQAIVDATGKKMGAVIALHDITERKEAEAAVQASELRLNSILNSLQDIVWSVVFESGGTQKLVFINPVAEKIYGRPCEEFLKNSDLWQEIIHPEDRDRSQKSSQEIMQQNRSEMEYRIVWPSGEVRWVRTRAWLIRDAAGAIIRVDGLTSDITDRKLAEKTQARLTAIIEAATDFVGTSDALGNVLYLNRAGRQMVGLGEDAEVTGIAFADLMPEAFTDGLLNQAVPTALRDGAWSGESALLHRDGRQIPVSQAIVSHKSDSGEVEFFSTVIRDISDRKQIEAALAERARLAAFRADVDIALTRSDSLQGILQLCAEALVQHLDAAFARIWMLKVEEQVLELQASAGMYRHLNGPHSRILVGQFKIGRIAEEGLPYLTNSVLADPLVSDKEWAKRQGMVAFAGYPLMIEGQLLGVIAMFSRHVLTTATVSALEFAADEIALGIKRLQAESALRLSEARYRQLAQREELLNQLASQIRNSLEVDTILETAVQEVRKLLQIDRCLFVWQRQPSGELVWEAVKEAKGSELSSFLGVRSVPVTPVVEQFLHLGMIRAGDLATEPGVQEFLALWGYTALLALPIVTASGEMGMLICGHHSGPRPWSDSEVELLQAVAGSVAIALFQAELYTSAQDAAALAQEKAQQLEQTLSQLQQTQAQLIQSEKMSSLGQLVAGVAHEINNPVNFIYGNLTYLSDYTQELLTIVKLYQQSCPNPNSELQKQLEELDIDFIREDLPKIVSSMSLGTERIRDIVLSLRNFSRLDEAEMKAVDIHEGIDNTLLILENRVKAKSDRPAVQIVKAYGELPLVECYAGQLNQVFMNVLANALDALEEAKDLKPSASRIPWVRIQTEVAGADRVCIRIKDNGPGMSEEVAKRLFDPFFTTKPVGKGTGLGLAISYQIVVDKHRGQMRCYSAPGEGAELAIEIPIRQVS